MKNRKAGLIILVLLAFAPCLASADKPISFSADQMSGAAGKKNETTQLRGNAVVTVGTLQITGDLIELTGKNYRYVTATGNVRGSDSEKGFSFSATQLNYDRETEVASFQGNASLSDTKNKVEASAGLISYNQKTEIAFLQVNVKLKRNEIDCSSGFALYRRTISMLELSGSPLVNRSGDEFRADRISVNLETEYITLDGTVSGKLKDAKKEGDAQPPAAAAGNTPAATPASTGNPTGGLPSGSAAASESETGKEPKQ
jgi:lipopolysaccharide export system protein LptA